MTAIANAVARVGNFTSSEIVALMSNGKAKDSIGKPALTYIEECNYERRLGRSISTESNARPLTWGKMVETRVFELLGLEYKLISQETIQHPVFSYWAGSPDAEKFGDEKTVVDIKSPITLKSFCQLVEPLYMADPLTGMDAMNWIRNEHRDGEKYYWQLVSNAILTGARFAELIVYCPFFYELKGIQEMASPSLNLDKAYNWIYYADVDELPYLIHGGKYQNLNVIRFEVSEVDKAALQNRVKECGRLLITI